MGRPAGALAGGAAVFFAGPDGGVCGRRAITGFPQAGHGPRQATRPAGATVLITSPHPHVAETLRLPCAFSCPPTHVLYHWNTKARKVSPVASSAEVATERLRRLAEAVRRSAAAHSDVIAARDAEIYLARQAGLTTYQIAKASGISRAQLNRVLADQAIRAQNNPAADLENPGAVA